MRAAALAVAAVVLAGVAASSAGAVVTDGTIRVNRGAAGITLGMKRGEVVDRLGAPVFQNANGFMQYGPDEGPLFDLYLNENRRVRLLGISGEGFCLRAGGPCMFDRYGLRKLRNRFGDRLKVIEAETGEPVNVVRGRFHDRRAFTAFSTTSQRPRARIIMVFIGWCPPKPAVCGA